MISSCLLLAFAVTFALRTRLAMLNKRNETRFAALSEDEKSKLGADTGGEIWDNDPRYRFMT